MLVSITVVENTDHGQRGIVSSGLGLTAITLNSFFLSVFICLKSNSVNKSHHRQ